MFAIIKDVQHSYCILMGCIINRSSKRSLVPAEVYLGLTVTDATDKTVNKDKSYFTDLIADLLAGRIAEKLFMKSENNAGAESDLEKATKIAFKMVTKYGRIIRCRLRQLPKL